MDSGPDRFASSTRCSTANSSGPCASWLPRTTRRRKTVSLGFTGQGKRHVNVGYVVEHPIWKTSYRLRIEKNGKLFIQGWAIVENTSDDDWNDVRMVAGLGPADHASR